MDYQVSLTPLARHDLREIVRYIASDNPTRARTFSDFLVKSTERLAEFPEIGRVVPEFGDDSLREIIVRSYRIIYRVDHGPRFVDVVRFWHAARGTPTFG